MRSRQAGLGAVLGAEPMCGAREAAAPGEPPPPAPRSPAASRLPRARCFRAALSAPARYKAGSARGLAAAWDGKGHPAKEGGNQQPAGPEPQLPRWPGEAVPARRRRQRFPCPVGCSLGERRPGPQVG